MQKFCSLCIAGAMLVYAGAVAFGAELKIGPGDSVQTVLAAQKGTRLSIRVRSGQEITGVVRDVNASVVQIGAVGGKEFFDAVIPLGAIEAVFVRTRA